MKRKIKFRAWIGIGMEYNVIVGKFGAFFVNPGAKGDGINEKDTACLTEFNTIYPNTTPIMQFTGLLDKNGKEIYEGDVVEGDMHPRTRWIEFENGCFILVHGDCCKQPADSVYLHEKEVIGNIYENPGLLK